MRKVLLASTALVAIAGPACAQEIVDAPVLDAIQTTSLGHQVTELARWATQSAQMITQINTQITTLEALTHATNYGTIVGELAQLGIRNPLPVSPYAVQALMNGTGGAAGTLGSLGALFGGTTSANTVYVPTTGTWVGNEIARNGGGLAGGQALALQLYQSSQQRLTAMTTLQAQINLTTDPSMRGTLIARWDAEKANIETTNTQAAVLASYMAIEAKVADQRANEKMQMDAAAFVTQAQADGAW